MKSQTPDKTPTAADVLGALDRRVNALNQRDAALLAEQLSLEAAGVTPMEPSSAPNTLKRAVELLNGEAAAHLVGASMGETLFGVILERAAIREAVALAGNQRLRAEIEHANEILTRYRAEWREIVRARLAALLTLRQANVDAHLFKERVAEREGLRLFWDCDPVLDPLFSPDLSDQCTQFFEELVSRGFATAKEVR